MGKNDLLELIKDIGGAGIYPTGDLYRWYVGMMEEEGRDPVTHRRFGMTLKGFGLANVSRSVEGKTVRCWILSRPWERRANDPAEYDDPT